MEYCPLWKTGMMKIANFVVRRRIAAIFILVILTVDSFPQTFDSIPALQAVTWPSGVKKPLFVPIWASLYSLSGNSTDPGSNTVETSLYEPYNGGTDGWWDNLFEEFMYAGIDNSIILTRATVTPNGDWNNLVTRMIPALRRANIYSIQRFGQFDDCGAWAGTYKNLTGAVAVNWADTANVIKIMWDFNIKRFHDYLPKELWLRYNGKPLWVGWGSGGTNMNGNVSKVLRAVKALFKATYNEDLFIVVDQAWKKGDPTITGAESDAYQSWFGGGNSNTVTDWDGYKVEVLVPGFSVPGHGADFDRAHGSRYRDALNIGVSQATDIQIEEGYVDMREGCGIYRSPTWDYPSQYLDILREYLDQSTLTRRFQAEACDSFYNKASSNTSVVFSSRKLDAAVLPAPNLGWYVGNTDAGDWLLWKEVFFAQGNYEAFIRYSSSSAENRIALSIGGKIDTVSLPQTNGAFMGKKIATRALSDKTDVKVTMITGGINVDFVQISKSDLSANIPILNQSYCRDSELKYAQTSHGAVLRFAVLLDMANVTLRIYDARGRLTESIIRRSLVTKGQTMEMAFPRIHAGMYVAKMTVMDKNGIVQMEKNIAFPVLPMQTMQ